MEKSKSIKKGQRKKQDVWREILKGAGMGVVNSPPPPQKKISNLEKEDAVINTPVPEF